MSAISKENAIEQEPRERPLPTIGKLKEVIKDLPDDIPVYICYEGIDIEARLAELWEERVSSRERCWTRGVWLSTKKNGISLSRTKTIAVYQGAGHQRMELCVRWQRLGLMPV
jgi:hypothetical protein